MIPAFFDSTRFIFQENLFESPFRIDYLGAYQATGWPVFIQTTSLDRIAQDAQVWKQAAEKCAQLEEILEIGSSEAAGHYIVTKIPADQACVPLLWAGAPLSPRQAITITTELCEAVICLHRQRYIHAEIDPGSIMILGADHPTLAVLRRSNLFTALGFYLTPNKGKSEERQPVDAGNLIDKTARLKAVHEIYVHFLSKFYLGEAPAALKDCLSGQEGRFLDGWMYALLNPFVAPQCAIGRIDPSVDVYSIGAVLYWMLTRSYPFYRIEVSSWNSQGLWPPEIEQDIRLHRTLEAILQQKLSTELALVGVPPEIEPLLRKAMDGLTEKRFQHVSDFSTALKRIKWKTLFVAVRNSAGQPLQGIKVTLSGGHLPSGEIEKLTDSEGTLEVEDLLAGSYRVSVDTKNFRPYEQTVTITENTAEERLEITLQAWSLFERLKRAL